MEYNLWIGETFDDAADTGWCLGEEPVRREQAIETLGIEKVLEAERAAIAERWERIQSLSMSPVNVASVVLINEACEVLFNLIHSAQVGHTP